MAKALLAWTRRGCRLKRGLDDGESRRRRVAEGKYFPKPATSPRKRHLAALSIERPRRSSKLDRYSIVLGRPRRSSKLDRYSIVLG